MFIDIYSNIIAAILLIDIQYIDIHVEFLLNSIFKLYILLDRYAKKIDIYII